MQEESSKPIMPASNETNSSLEELQVSVKSNRCPYCHDDVEPEGSVVCQDCLTRHHPECWDEGFHCSSCSSSNKLISSSEPPRVSTTSTTAPPTAQNTNWEDFGRPDLAVQQSRGHQEDQAVQSIHDREAAPLEAVPDHLRCSKEDCEMRGAMYSRYSKERLCIEHARKHDLSIWVGKSLVIVGILFGSLAIFVKFLSFWFFIVGLVFILLPIVIFSLLTSEGED